MNPERTQTFCICDAQTPEAIRKVAEQLGDASRKSNEVLQSMVR